MEKSVSFRKKTQKIVSSTYKALRQEMYTMGNIHILDTEISNKIAAGEVVERPLSIVKELVENSIDAGATSICVEIRNGGISHIRVTDNGCGMSEEDARICFLRHATSKIQTDSDLDAIYTLGFRGEALSSIGAVTRVTLYTKRAEDEAGTCVTCEGGEILTAKDAGTPNGTIVEVQDLFYNTPARLKFLKKNATEAGYISDIIGRLAFAHPEISFRLIRDGKEILFTPGDNKLINVVYAVYGKDYARNMLGVDYEFNGIRVSGVIGKGTLVRANRNNETFFVNKRYIKSALMIRALEEAYKNQIMISKFPTAILNVELDVSSVDINVHPTKLECKFSNEQDIYQAVYHAVKTALYALPNVPEINRTEEKTESVFKADTGKQSSFEDTLREKSKNIVHPASEFKYKTQKRSDVNMWDFIGDNKDIENTEEKIKEEIKEETKRPALREYDMPAMKNIADETPAATPEPIPPVGELYDNPVKADEPVSANIDQNEKTNIENKIPDDHNEPVKGDVLAMLDYAIQCSIKRKPVRIKVREKDESEITNPEDPDDRWEAFLIKANEEYNEQNKNIFEMENFRIIGQLFETYILVEQEDKLLMIDQHAAHERLNYEQLKRDIECMDVQPQILLMPVEVHLTGEEAAIYEENSEMIYQLGFDVELKDNNDIEIKSTPGDFGYSETEDLFLELLTQIGEMKQEIITDGMQRLIYTIACKASVKANMEMSMQEMENLVREVFALKNINTCPHGRPIVISMSKKEIEKDFKRIV